MNNKIVFPKPTLISLNGIQLEVYEAGLQNIGKPIVLCHGWPQHAYTWRYQISSLVDEGYHVIIPNQRGYGNSSSPKEVSAFDIEHLAGDLVALLDYFDYEKAIFVGHDWGATVVWGLTMLHPDRVDKIINLSVPYLERGEKPWVEFIEELLGSDNYMVHFNKYPGVADAVLDEHTTQFLRNLFRKNVPIIKPQHGMAFINLAKEEEPLGEPVMSDDDLSVFVSAFKASGFAGSINWYRNIDRNWHIYADVNPVILQPTLMIYGDKDPVQKSVTMIDYVPNAEVVNLDCGHWIQEEKPEEINQIFLKWLKKWTS